MRRLSAGWDIKSRSDAFRKCNSDANTVKARSSVISRHMHKTYHRQPNYSLDETALAGSELQYERKNVDRRVPCGQSTGRSDSRTDSGLWRSSLPPSGPGQDGANGWR